MRISDDFDFANWNYNGFSQQPVSPVDYVNTYTFTADNPAHFSYILSIIHEKLRPYTGEMLMKQWYRGQANVDNVLLPSLIRQYFENGLECSLPVFQRSLLEIFLAECFDSTEFEYLPYKTGNAVIEHLADMQHYALPTSLLDWSEDPFVALYFACEKAFTGNPKKDAAVYIFNPVLYNMVRAIIVAGNAAPRALHLHHNVIPNISAPHNIGAAEYDDFVISSKCDPSSFYDKRMWDKNPLIMDPPINALHLPLAIQVPRKNNRIVAQVGTFVAYNLREFPISGSKGNAYYGFQHVELEKIQEYYLKNSWFRTPNYTTEKVIEDGIPFLYKICIRKESMGAFKDFLNAIGVNQSKVYPEMDKKAAEIMKKYITRKTN